MVRLLFRRKTQRKRLDSIGERADNTAPMKRTPERSTPPAPILVSWIGNTELKVMAKRDANNGKV